MIPKVLKNSFFFNLEKKIYAKCLKRIGKFKKIKVYIYIYIYIYIYLNVALIANVYIWCE